MPWPIALCPDHAGPRMVIGPDVTTHDLDALFWPFTRRPSNESRAIGEAIAVFVGIMPAGVDDQHIALADCMAAGSSSALPVIGSDVFLGKLTTMPVPKGCAFGQSVGQVAKRLGLPRSTAQRIVGALQDERLVVISAQGSGLRRGPERTVCALRRRLAKCSVNYRGQWTVLSGRLTGRPGVGSDRAGFHAMRFRREPGRLPGIAWRDPRRSAGL